MADLDEAAALADVSDVAYAQIALLERDLWAVLQDLVSLVARLLELLVELLEVRGLARGADQLPGLGVDYRVSGREYSLLVLVKADNSRGEEGLQLGEGVND